jgi:hypothetical protein
VSPGKNLAERRHAYIIKMKLIAEPKDLTPVAKPINKSDNALKIRFTLNETARQNKQLHTTMRIMSEYLKLEQMQ